MKESGKVPGQGRLARDNRVPSEPLGYLLMMEKEGRYWVWDPRHYKDPMEARMGLAMALRQAPSEHWAIGVLTLLEDVEPPAG